MRIKSLGRPHLISVGAFDYAWDFEWEDDNWAIVRGYRHYFSVSESFTDFAVARASKQKLSKGLNGPDRQPLVDLFNGLWTRLD
jgi:hypothetical protein